MCAPKAMSFKNAFAILLPLFLFAVLLAALIISVANDVYAFVKPDNDIPLVIDTAPDVNTLANVLSETGIIDNALAFKIYLRSKGISGIIDEAVGEWILNSDMSYRDILSVFY